jgi:uncharacterized protein (DUF1778 family)
VKTKQISARISPATKGEVEEFLRARGLKQNRFVEDALKHYLRVLRSLPEEGRMASSLVFTNQSFEEIVHSLQNPGKPTRALIKLMRGELDPEDGLY